MSGRKQVEDAEGSPSRLEALALEFLTRAQTAERDAEDARAEGKRVREVAGQFIEQDKGVRQQRDTALQLLGDVLFQLQGTGAPVFRLNPPMGDGAKHDLIRVLQLSMGEDTVEDTPKKPGVGVGVVCFQNGKILLGKRHPDIDGGGQWELPGGSVEWGEAWAGAARREVEEETGIMILSNYRFVTAKEDHRPGDDKHNAIIFVRFDVRGKAEVKEPDKCTEWGWFLLDKLPEGPMFPALRELLTVDRDLLA